MNMQVKIHKAEGRKIISLCDEDLIGKKFEQDDLQLDVSEYFYKGENLSKEKILEEIKDANSLNIVGKNSIQFALENNLIQKEKIITIKNIPHIIVILE